MLDGKSRGSVPDVKSALSRYVLKGISRCLIDHLLSVDNGHVIESQGMTTLKSKWNLGAQVGTFSPQGKQ